MIRRLLTALLIAILGLAAIAWPMSRAGFAITSDSGKTRLTVGISQRVLFLAAVPRDERSPFQRDRFTITSGNSGLNPPQPPAMPRPPLPPGHAPVPSPSAKYHLRSWLWPTIDLSDSLRIVIPIPLVLVVAIAGLTLVLLIGARRRRRQRSGQCIACGYPRAAESGPCSECGAAPGEALARAGAQRVGIVRDAGLIMFAVLLAVSAAVWLTIERDDRAQALHDARVLSYPWYIGVTQPRLTGAVVVAAPGTLDQVLASAPPGTIVVLLPGAHDLGDRFRRTGSTGIQSLEDIWLLGSGRDVTTLSIEFERAKRVRIEGVTIECNSTPFTDIRRDGRLQLVDCRIQGYNSGAGGSNSMYASDTVLLIEGCEFEGHSGRASSRGRGGNALDLRGETRVFIRATRFIDNSEIFRSSDGVLDDCSIIMTEASGVQLPAQAGASPQRTPPPIQLPRGRHLYLRNLDMPATRWPVQPTNPAIIHMLDDPADLVRLTSRSAARSANWQDEDVRNAVLHLAPWNDPSFWEHLLLHPSPEIRRIASKQRSLPHLVQPEISFETALASLDEAVITPAATIALLRNPGASRPALEELKSTGAERQQQNAAAMLLLIDIEPPVVDMLDFAKRRAP